MAYLILLRISYLSLSLIRGVVYRKLLWVRDYIYIINIKFGLKCLFLVAFDTFLIFILRKQTYSLLRGWVVFNIRTRNTFKEKRGKTTTFSSLLL